CAKDTGNYAYGLNRFDVW
nr:immunoglobulin heavy chain junction region [Macaca mulatta]